MKRLRGPELRMPALKMPIFLVDLYWDLRDRRLLPLVALVVVAIAAAPFLLGGSKESPPPAGSPAAEAAAAIAAEGAPASSFTVVQAEPGLRDYRKRLARRRPSDPFVQRNAGSGGGGEAQGQGSQAKAQSTFTTTTTTRSPAGGSGSAGGGANSGSGAGAESTSPTTSPPSGGKAGGGNAGSGGGNSNSGGGTAQKPHLTLFAFAIDVKITRLDAKGGEGGTGGGGNSTSSPEPVVKRGVLPLTQLPGEKAPVVTYMGASEKGKPLLLVSAKVQSVFGETKCVTGEEACQLLEVEPGFPVTFVYGENKTRYRINVLKIEPVVVGASGSSVGSTSAGGH